MSEMTYDQMLSIGRGRVEESMRAAGERVLKAKDCNGQEDCPAPHHLTCCLAKKK